MSVTFITLKCPQCNGELEVKDGLDSYYCDYCGSKIILSGQSNAAYKAKTKIKKYEHEEKMLDKEYEYAKYKMEEKKEKKAEGKKSAWKVFGVILLLGCMSAWGHDQASNREEKKLQSIVDEIQVDIKNGDFDQAYIKAQGIRYTEDNNYDLEKKWNSTRREVIDRIIEAEKKATGKATHKPEKNGLFD